VSAPAPAPVIGVLALQGDVREHLEVLADLGARPLAVRRESELARCDGLVLPGGESTTMVKLAGIFDLLMPLRARISAGLPVFGTCAGMILLADRIEDGVIGQETLGGLDITVRRNAFGRQVDSFEADLEFAGLDAPVHAIFIRAPWVEEVGEGIEVLARVPEESGHDPAAGGAVGGAVRGAVGGAAGGAAGRIVAVRQGPLMATSFHPEVGGDTRIHRVFVDLVTSYSSY